MKKYAIIIITEKITDSEALRLDKMLEEFTARNNSMLNRVGMFQHVEGQT